MTTLKESVLKSFREKFDYRFYGRPKLIQVKPEELESFLDTTIDRVLDAAKGCFPKQRVENIEEQEYEQVVGFNRAIRDALKNFDALKGDNK